MPAPPVAEPRARLLAGQCQTLGPGLRRIVAGNAGPLTGPGTNTYLLGERRIAVIDPGPPDARHLDNILAAAGGAIESILVTHTHRDHSPLAAALAARTGAAVIGLPAPQDDRQDAGFRADRHPGDGEPLEVGGRRLLAIHTPGHASNCVCYLLEEERLLFSGDHLLEGVTPVIPPPDGDMGDYLRSIERLGAFDFERIAPGHGGVIAEGKEQLALVHAHRLARERKLLDALAGEDTGQGAALEWLLERVYDDVPASRWPLARLTLRAHLLKLEHEGRIEARDGDRWIRAA